jgi:4,5-DOPA dioxygenase extradiol
MMHSLFLCHGGPTIVVEENEYTQFLKEYGKKVTPKAIVIFTAHWESEITTISSVEGTYDMIYDFYGFQRELYEMKYPAKGSPELAEKISHLLEESGIKSNLDTKRGLDHGTWDLLYLMYPKADIPVVQMSINPFMTMEEQYKIGKALRALGGEDILVIGSGSTVHNLGTVDWEATKAQKWAVDFDDWLVEKVEAKELKQLFDYQKLAPNAKRAVPREEHIVPMFIAMGAGSNIHPKLLHREYIYGTLTYLGFEF